MKKEIFRKSKKSARAQEFIQSEPESTPSKQSNTIANACPQTQEIRGKKENAQKYFDAGAGKEKAYFAFAGLVAILLFAGMLFPIDEQKIGDYQAGQEAGNWQLYLAFLGLPSAGMGSPLLLLSIIVVIITALAYMAGSMMQIEELKQFSKAELFQAGATVLIVAAILAIILFTNTALEYSASQTSSPCIEESLGGTNAPGASDPLVLTYAYCYMSSFSRLAAAATRDATREGIDYASAAYTSVGYMSDRWYTAYAGFTMRPNAHKRLDSEIKGLEFQNLQNSLISLEAQKFVLGGIIPTLGPAALFLGILLRALVYTRRLGGLLMACGVALMIVWPATYLLAWISLQSAIYGQQAQDSGDGLVCPDSCKIEPPFAYLKSVNDGTKMDASKTLDRDELIVQIESSFGSDALVDLRDVETLLSKEIQTCYPNKDYSSSGVNFEFAENCPKACRYLPTPINCDISACTNLPNACKAIRQMDMGDVADNCMLNPQWACTEAQCPEYCKMQLPQVQYDTGDPYSYGGDNSKKVIPSENSGVCGQSPCSDCSYHWRRYIASGGESMSISGLQACQQCLEKSPDCMLAIPALLGTTCDSTGSCGQRISLAEYIEAKEGGSTINACPVDCRIVFGADATNYRDEAFVKYCTPESKDYIGACNSCPVQCKLNASESLGASADTKKGLLPGLGIEVECAEAPTFDQTTFVMDASVSSECKRCPLQCRFTNPDSVKDPDSLGADAFYSSVHYSFPCYYYPLTNDGSEYPCGIKINYGNENTCNDERYPSSWHAFTYISSTGSCASVPVEEEVPACAPAKEAYVGHSNVQYCPKFMVNKAPYVVEGGLKKLSQGDEFYRPALLFGRIPANPDVSGECTTYDAIKFCTGEDESGEEYCSDSCKVDREESGPFYCQVSDLTSAYAQINSNEKYCDDCYPLNAQNTTGPQCQVMLNAGGEIIFPYGCDESCSIVESGTNLRIDPLEFATKEKNGEATGCYGFCYPRLPFPTSAQCAEYEEPPQDEPNSREFANCAACPQECRYDYNADGSGASLPEGANEYCVYDIDDKYKQNCNHLCTGAQPVNDGGEWDGWVSNCEDNNAYSCTTGEEGNYWVRVETFADYIVETPIESSCPITDYPDCCRNVVPYDGCSHYNIGDMCCGENGDEECTETWFQSDDVCGAGEGSDLYSLQEDYTPQVCERGHKYPALDELLKNEGNPNYNECGDLSLTGADGEAQNPDLHLCGSVGSGTYSSKSGGTAVEVCKNDAEDAGTCYAHYNSLYVSCLPQTDISKNVPPPEGNPHLEDESCQECPLFCRVDTAGSSIKYSQVCDIGNWKIVGPKPQCDVLSQCDLRTNTEGKADYGYCGVNIEEFSLEKTNDGNCQLPSTGYGIGCPARCRVIIEKGDLSALPTECNTGDIGDACADLISYCKAEPPSRLCQGCLSCQKDCLSLPYVRQNCDELCVPASNLQGRSALSPQDLVSSWNGAVGNTAWRNIAALAIAAFVLPIFCILITLSFIKSLSPLLGGDIEIPGLSKLFR